VRLSPGSGSSLFGRPAALAYAADLGCWDEAAGQMLADPPYWP